MYGKTWLIQNLVIQNLAISQTLFWAYIPRKKNAYKFTCFTTLIIRNLKEKYILLQKFLYNSSQIIWNSIQGLKPQPTFH
jgi:hypothetical protein